MAIYQRLIDLDLALTQSSRENIQFINDFPNTTESERKEIFNRLTTQYMQGDKISMLPQCRCGTFRFKVTKPITCPYCGTEVKASIEENIESFIWFKKPEKILALMSPMVYTMLCERFTKQGWNLIHYFTDRTYNPNVKDTPFMARIRDKGFNRGWNNFCLQFDDIMEFLFTLKDFDNIRKGEADYLFYLWKKERDKFFCDHLPLPNSSLFVFENTNTGIYRNGPTGKAMNYISIMLSIEKSIQPLSDQAKENRVAKMYQKIAEYIKEHIKSELSPKQGQIRRNTIATKNALASRCVITSITDPWDPNSVAVPWVVGLTMFRLHLINKLVLKKGMSLNNAINMLMTHTGRYNEILHGYLNELIEEAPNKKIWCTLQRNPSLKQGSMQYVYIGKFKTDPGDKTIGMPISIVKAPNAITVGLPYRNVRLTLV